MNNQKFIRQLPLIGEKGQSHLANSHVVIVGVGALGTVAAELLARSGVGHLTLIDRDVIELSNLQRQSLYEFSDISQSKVLCAKKHLQLIRPEITIDVRAVHLDNKNISDCVPINVDLILDCTDTMSIRWLLNDYARKNSIPWIFASAIGWTGMLQLILPKSACLKCHFPTNAHGTTCTESGVIAMTTHMVATIQSSLALRFLIKENLTSFCNILFSLNLQKLELKKFVVKKNIDCDCCKENFVALETNNEQKEIVRFCSSGQYQVCKINSVDLKSLALVVSNEFDIVTLDSVCLRFGQLTVFADGRALIKCKSEIEAVSLYDKYIQN